VLDRMTLAEALAGARQDAPVRLAVGDRQEVA
jgi:hypothetical protein